MSQAWFSISFCLMSRIAHFPSVLSQNVTEFAVLPHYWESLYYKRQVKKLPN